MERINPLFMGAGVCVLALLVLPMSAYAQEAPAVSDAIPWNVILTVSGFGALGGVIYELIVLHGNIEWPHRTTSTEVPAGGFTHAQLDHLFDLGILARIIVGAAAAIVVFWALPLEQGIRLLAVSLLAGSAGTAVFRSLQDRLLASLNAAKVEAAADGLEELNEQLGDPTAPSAGARSWAPNTVTNDVAEIRGRVQALLKVVRHKAKRI